MSIRKSSNTGIPFGNTAGRPASPAVGQPYFNGQENRLELYTQNIGWQNVVPETPGVLSYTGSVLESNATNTIVITGTNFATGAIVSLIGNDGTEYTANTTTVNSIGQVTAVFGALPASKDPYDIKLVNPSGLYGLAVDMVFVNDTPSWTTPAGSLGTFNEGSSVSVTVAATDEENNTITYSSSGLPAWLTLNSSTGVISGTAPGISQATTYSFTINASDGINTSVSRNFNITINSTITWNTASGNLATIYDISRSGFTYTLSTTALSNTVSYSVTSGSLPTGLSLNSSTGVISGTASAVGSDTTSTFTITASDESSTASRSFNILVKSPYTESFSGSGNWISPLTGNISVELMGGGGGGSTGFEAWASGGGGGAYILATYSVTQGQSYAFSVGSAGAAQTTCNNAYWAILGKGGNSSFASMVASGGYGGGAVSAGQGANTSAAGSYTTTGALSVLKNYNGQNGGNSSANYGGGSNGLQNGEGNATYGSGAANVQNGHPGTHATGNGNGGAGGPSCQGGAHRGGGNGSMGFVTITY